MVAIYIINNKYNDCCNMFNFTDINFENITSLESIEKYNLKFHPIFIEYNNLINLNELKNISNKVNLLFIKNNDKLYNY